MENLEKKNAISLALSIFRFSGPNDFVYIGTKLQINETKLDDNKVIMPYNDLHVIYVMS